MILIPQNKLTFIFQKQKDAAKFLEISEAAISKKLKNNTYKKLTIEEVKNLPGIVVLKQGRPFLHAENFNPLRQHDNNILQNNTFIFNK